MKSLLSVIIISLAYCHSFGQSGDKPEMNIIYGEKHIFTIETPEDWVNDKPLAQKIGLVCFFYPTIETDKDIKNYFYANGIDKKTPDETLDQFIEGDLKQFRKKYPELSYKEIKVGFTGGLKNSKMLSFSNLSDRYKEEVLYGETDDTILIFSFAAMTEEAYDKYQPVFDTFISSFKYRGNNPQPFLDYMKKKNGTF